jgi:hypothetical protein
VLTVDDPKVAVRTEQKRYLNSVYPLTFVLARGKNTPGLVVYQTIFQHPARERIERLEGAT